GELLGGKAGAIATSFKNNALISALTKKGAFKFADYPSYISAAHFTQALTAVATGSPPATTIAGPLATTQTMISAAAQPPATPASVALAATQATITTFAQVQAWANANPTVPAAQAILELLKTAHGDFDTFRASLESWYDATMDRISGAYKRWAL